MGLAAAVTAAPSSEKELADLLATASEESRAVAVWGGGTHREMGYPPHTDWALSTSALAGISVWEPDDLTVVVGAGTRVSDLEEELGSAGQTAVLAETGAGTVGGAVATATSGYRRLRYGPIRDRVLEVRAVTGDGRVVKGGGRVVKNVSGYDLPRLYCGSFGSLGVITSVCLKLWPLAETTATVSIPPGAELPPIYRPLALLETRQEIRVLLSGTAAEVDHQSSTLGGETNPGLHYPPPPGGETVWSVRVRPGHLAEAVRRLPSDRSYVAQGRVGEASFGASASYRVGDLRGWVESVGGAVVRLRGGGDDDPWGTPPPGLDLQRRVVAAFDPARIVEPGRLPGRI